MGLESLQDVWEGDVETLIMGDFNIDMGRKEAGRKADMQRLSKHHLEHNGWRHLLEEATRRKMKCTGKQQDSAIDWMVTNTPEKYTRAGVTWMGTGADHALIWAERSLQQGLGQKRKTRKRIWKKYTDERLKQEAGKVDWELSDQPHTREGLDRMVEELEEKIKKVMTKVAPMKTVEVKPRKMEWITAELREGRKKSMELQRQYHNT